MAPLYRPNAGIVVFNREGKVLLCQRKDVKNAWQFPQGGIEPRETPKKAALRELKEETSITSVKWVTTIEQPVRYDFPPEVMSQLRRRGILHVGQEMYWTLAYFYGNETEINLCTDEPEFSSFRWSTFAEACELIVDFKKEAYRYAAENLQKLIEDYKSF